MKLTTNTQVHVHLIMLGVWVCFILPTLIWWRESILWVAFMSLYANIVSHWGAYQGARSQQATEDKD